jgi:hypothetical protein
LEFEILESRVVPSGSTLSPFLASSPTPQQIALLDANDIVVFGTPASSSSSTSSTTYSLSSVPQLSSLPGAKASIYLNFTGDFTPSWGAFSNITTPAYDIDGDPTTFTQTELNNITQIWQYVAEDFAPFNINVTTVQPTNMGHGYTQKIDIGGGGSWLGFLSGGVSYIGSFLSQWVPNISFVFPDNLATGLPKDVGDSCSHEAGHSFGLYHQSQYDSSGNKIAEYYTGPGDGTAPIMGNSYNAPLSRWWLGPNDNGATDIQDDMAVISNSTNGFGYRDDSTGNTMATARALTVNNGQISGAGIIIKTTDTNFWSFTTGAGQITLNMNVAAGVNNLVGKLVLEAANGNVIATGDDNSSTAYSATITANVAAGTYYLVAESHGGYGDVGQYTLSGSIIPASGLAIDAGGNAVGNFVGDTDYSGGHSYTTTHSIDTSAVANPAPQLVYQSERYGAFTYTIQNLTPGASYTVRLHFAEIYWSAAGKRLFYVKINGTMVLYNFDVFATAGGEYKAVVESFTAVADANGNITLKFTGIVDSAIVSGIEITAVSGTINAGGNAVGNFVGDIDYNGGHSYTTTHSIDTSAVANPAPQQVYQSERYGAFTYTIQNLTPGASYTVRLHFAEIYWSAAGKRLFYVKINGKMVLYNFDVFATAGGEYKAVVESFTAVADANGNITLKFTGIVDSAIVSGIEITAVSSTSASPSSLATNPQSSNQSQGSLAHFLSATPSATTGSIVGSPSIQTGRSLQVIAGAMVTQKSSDLPLSDPFVGSPKHAKSTQTDWIEELLVEWLL